MAQLPMYAAAVNSPSTELAADINATATSIDVLDASKLPAAPNLVTVGGDETAETVMYTGKTGNTLTGCTRGFEGTAKGWAAGSPAARNHTAYDYEAGRANISDLDERVANIVIPDGTTTEKGIVQLSDATDGTRSTVAATEKAVNDARASVEGKIGNLAELNTADKSSVVAALNEVFTSGSEFKGDVADAITAKGVPTSASDSKETFVQNIEAIETSTVINGQIEQVVPYAETISANDPIYTTETYLNNITISGGLPVGAGRSVTWSPDGVYLAVAHNGSPYLTLYKRAGNTLTKMPNPSVLPTGLGLACGFSPDGTYLAIAHINSPYLTIYKRSGDTFTKLANPSVLPTNEAYSVAWSPDGTYLAIGQNNSPFINIYKRSGDTFTKLTNPTTLPPAICYGAAFSPDGVYLAFAHTTTPFMTIYKRSGDTFTKLADPTVLPPGSTLSVAWSVDGLSVAFGAAIAPFLAIYKRSGDTFTKAANPADVPTGTVNGIKYSPDGEHLSLAFTGSPYVINYRISPNSYLRLANVSPLPGGNGTSLDYTSDGSLLALGAGSGDYLIVYNYSMPAFKSSNDINELLVASSTGYALESGSAGESKNAVIIWR